MPWYDYRCESCASSFEAHRSVELRDEAPCPSCGSPRVRRAMPLTVTLVKSARAVESDGCCGGMGERGSCACAAAEDAALAR